MLKGFIVKPNSAINFHGCFKMLGLNNIFSKEAVPPSSHESA